MKPGRSKLFIFISSIALLVVLIIQVNWIFETAKIKENLFNEKANMVLARTTEALCADKSLCRQMDVLIGKNEMQRIDSLFQHFMNFYNFHVGYSFEVVKPKPFSSDYADDLSRKTHPDQVGCYTKSLDEVAAKGGWELKLLFPEKKQFILAELGSLFITSLILILVVLILFRLTVQSLLEEKRLSEHTNDFLNNMTHEFKTPLTNIALAGKMMIKEQNLRQEDKIKHFSGIILEENEKLRLQVEQVLSMTALERGEIPIQKGELNIHQVLLDVLKSMSMQIEHEQAILKLSLTAEQFIVRGDKIHLTNALRNLIDNAIKYSGGRPELYIQTSNLDFSLIILISDKGIGIEKEYEKKVFDKFFRIPTGDVHDVKGFGLGLAYVKKIIELHGGSIWLHGEKGKGTSFTLTLPHA